MYQVFYNDKGMLSHSFGMERGLWDCLIPIPHNKGQVQVPTTVRFNKESIHCFSKVHTHKPRTCKTTLVKLLCGTTVSHFCGWL
jgi:hypothetical protein